MFKFIKLEVVLVIGLIVITFALFGSVEGSVIVGSCVLGLITCSIAVLLSDFLCFVCGFIGKLLGFSDNKKPNTKVLSHEDSKLSFAPLAKMACFFAVFHALFGDHDSSEHHYEHHIFDDISECHGASYDNDMNNDDCF